MEEQSAFVKDLYEMYDKGEWRKILKLGQNNATEETKKYHWCWPYEQDLKDLKYELDKLGVKSLCSIGCGTGILEWCLNKCTGMEVKGIEVDEFYWTNFTSTKPFIDLKICKRRLSNSPLNNLLSRKRDEALLFCYFNNPDAFKTYIKYFYGDYVIIIGPPLKSKTKRSNPMPETPNFENPWLWFKVYTKEFGRDKDLLVIWKYNPNGAAQNKKQ